MSRSTTIALSTAGVLAAGAALALAVRPTRPNVPTASAPDGRSRPPRVVIAGGGYVGFCTARALRARLGTDQVEIAIIDPRPYMTYQPFLPEVAAGSIQPRHVIASHRRSLAGCTIITGSITGIDHASRTVTIAPPVPGSTQEEGKPYQIGYDHLVLALGAEARTLPIPGLAEQALGFKQVEEALALRNRVLSRIEDAASTWDAERRRRLLTFVFVGGGFAGVEAIAELEDMARALVATVDSVEQADVRFILVEGSRRILPELTEELSGYGLEQLRERGIDVRLNTFLSSCVDGHVVLSDGTELDADTIVWTAGVKAAPVLSESDLPVEARGRVTTLPTLQVARDGVVVDFFGQETNAFTGAAAIARRCSVPIFPVFMHRRADGHHELTIEKPLYVEKTDDRAADVLRVTQEVSAHIEAWIRRYPDEWFWLHDRWKSMRKE